MTASPSASKGSCWPSMTGASLCSLVLESYPPQCGGGTVAITGEIPADVVAGLDRPSEPGLAQAMWGWVEVTGTFDASGATPTIQLERDQPRRAVMFRRT